MTFTTTPPRWWTDPAWMRLEYEGPRCGLRTQGVPEVGERCPRCGFREGGS